MLYDLSNPYEIDKFKDAVRRHIEAKHAVNLSRKLPQRSNQQNRYFHVLLGYFGAEYGLSIEEVKHDIFKRICNADLFVRVKTNKHNQQVRYLRSSSELTTGEMTTAIERFRNFSASECDIYLPAPNESQFLLHCEKMIEQNKEYL